MTATQTRPSETTDPVERIRAIRPILSEHRAWADEHARIAPAALEAAREAGVFTLFAPSEVVGVEATLPQIIAAFEELGYADPTVAWHAGNSSAVCNAAPFLPAEARERIFAGPAGPFALSVVAAGANATPVEGGFLLSGRWPFATGCLDAPWASLSGLVREGDAVRMVEGQPDARSFLVPQGDFVVEHTWENASAMRGTGSHALTATDVFVPEEMTRPLLAPRHGDRPLHRLPVLVAGLPVVAGIAVGIARRVCDDATALLAAKVSRFDGKAHRDDPNQQFTIARAQAGVEGLFASLAAVADEVWREAEAGEVSERTRGKMWANSYWVFDQARAIVSDLLTVATSAVYAGRNPIETGLRDLHAICANTEHMRDLQAAYGRHLLGMEPGNPLY